IDGCEQHRESGEELREFATAEFAGDPGGEKDFGRRSERGEKTQREERIAEHRARERSHPRRQRRMIEIAPGRMFAACGVVKFVPKVAVATIEREVQQRGGTSKKEDGRSERLARQRPMRTLRRRGQL